MRGVMCVLCLLPPQYGTTSLVWAARKGHLKVVKQLVSHGADVNIAGTVSNVSGCRRARNWKSKPNIIGRTSVENLL